MTDIPTELEKAAIMNISYALNPMIPPLNVSQDEWKDLVNNFRKAVWDHWEDLEEVKP